MKKVVCLYLFVLISVMLITQNFNLTGAGARAAGMGGAFIGVADDATAIVWNPAGLSLLERPEASLVGRTISESKKYDWDNAPDNVSQNHFVLNFLSGVYPFKMGNKKIVGALAFQRQVDFYNYRNYDIISKEGLGGLDTITFGSGFGLFPFFSLGLSANIWTGKYDENWNLRADFEYKESYSGLNFVFGTMLDLSYLQNPIPLKIGSTFRTPFKLKVTWEDPDDIYFQYNIDFGEDQGDATIDFPMMLGFGTSYRIGDFFTLSADYEMRAYKDQKVVVKAGDPLVTINEGKLSEYDLNQFRLGAEYLIISDFAVIPIRIGAFTEPTTRHTGENSNPYIVGDQIKGSGFSLGSGLIFDKLSFDVSGTASGYEIDWGNNQIEKMIKTVIGLSGIFYFG